MFFNGGHGVPAPTSADHWTYKTDYVHVNAGGDVPIDPLVPVELSEISVN